MHVLEALTRGARAADVYLLARRGSLQNVFQASDLDPGLAQGTALFGRPAGFFKRWANWRVGWRLAAMSESTGDGSDQGKDLKVRRRVLHTSCAGLAHGIGREAFRDIHILDVA